MNDLILLAADAAPRDSYTWPDLIMGLACMALIAWIAWLIYRFMD